MSFTAKVKEIGKIFDATHELGAGGRQWIAHTLEDDASYTGFLYDTQPTNKPDQFDCVCIGEREPKTFKGNQVEKLPVYIKIRDRLNRA